MSEWSSTHSERRHWVQMSSQLHSRPYYPRRKSLFGTHWIRGWVILRAGLDLVAKREDWKSILWPSHPAVRVTPAHAY